jgi:hypothetical protein
VGTYQGPEFTGIEDLNGTVASFTSGAASNIIAHPYEPWTWPSMAGGTGILLGQVNAAGAAAEQDVTAITGDPNAFHQAYQTAAVTDPLGLQAGLQTPLDHMYQDQQLESQHEAATQQSLGEIQAESQAQQALNSSDQAIWNAYWAI